MTAGVDQSSMDPAANVRFNPVGSSQHKSVVKFTIKRIAKERRIVSSALNKVSATGSPPLAPPPSIPGAWPVLGHIRLVRPKAAVHLNRPFESVLLSAHLDRSVSQCQPKLGGSGGSCALLRASPPG